MFLISPTLAKFPFKETDHIEFKRKYTNSIAFVVCAFLNTDGGTIVIGIDEREGIVGVKNAKNTVPEIQRLLNRVIEPSVDNLVEISVLPLNGPEIIIVKVKKSDQLHSTFIRDTKKYYFRHGDRNIGFEEKDAKIYSLNEYGIKRITTDNVGDYLHHKIGNYASGSYFYKYMSLETALLCIRNKTIRFAEPSSWIDKYEGRFYNAIINGHKQSINNPPLTACCFTYRQDNEAAWKIYSYDKKGLDSRCIEFKIDRDELRKQILSVLDCNPDFCGKYKLYEGVVSYKDEQYINNLHKRKIRNDKKNVVNKSYNAFFDSFSIEKFLSLMLLKRNAFLHEQEVRFFLVPDDFEGYVKGSIDPVDIPVNWADILLEVRIDGKCTPFEKSLFKDELFNKGASGNPISDEKKVTLDPVGYNVYEQKRRQTLQIRQSPCHTTTAKTN